MASWVVADSGIFIATVLEETYTKQADALVNYWYQHDFQIAAPVLFRYEIISVMRKAVYRQQLSTTEAVERRGILMVQPVELMLDDTPLKRAYELATRFNRPATYDSQYLAVAERLGCEFWTADERLYNSVTPHLNWVRWLNNFTG